MKEDLNPELYKFLLYKLGLDSLRNSASKLDFFPWFVSTKSCCCSNKPWKKCKPSLQESVHTKSCGESTSPEDVTQPNSPRRVYFTCRDPLRKRKSFAASTTAPLLVAVSSKGAMLHEGSTAAKISSGFDFPFSDDDDIVEENDCVSHQLGSSEYSVKDQCIGSFKNNQNSFPEQGFPDPEQGFRDPEHIKESPAKNGLNLDAISNDDDDEECWKTFKLITPKAGRVNTVFKEDGKEVTIMPEFHNQTSPRTETTNTTENSPQLRTKHINDEALAEEESFKDILVAQKYSPLEKSESELDELCVEDIKGESLLSKLKRQVEFDRKTVMKLYKEIDEERSAAAEAASQAMTMITKLQQEKAFIDLDAHQCIRMMEEQAEHSSQALETAYELLAEKEKEIQDLEAEVRFYRSKYPDEYREEQLEFVRQCLYDTDDENEELEGFTDHITETVEAESLPYPEF